MPWHSYRTSCQTQAIERDVKHTTEASASVCGEAARNWYMMIVFSADNKRQHSTNIRLCLWLSWTVLMDGHVSDYCIVLKWFLNESLNCICWIDYCLCNLINGLKAHEANASHKAFWISIKTFRTVVAYKA